MTETENVEFRESWKSDHLKWICGFANADGGKLFIGRDDNGYAVGLPGYRKLMEDIPNTILNILGIVTSVYLRDADGRKYIEIDVPKSILPVDCNGVYYRRIGNTNQILRGNSLMEFLAQRSGITWDSVPVDLAIDELDPDCFSLFKEEAFRSHRIERSDLSLPPYDILEKLGLIHDRRLRKAAVLLFHKCPERLIPGAFTRIGRFRGVADLLYQDEIHGSLLSQAMKIVDLIFSKYLIAPVSYDGMTRVERYPYPKDAVREAVCNALIHNNWSRGIPIQIRIEDDALYVSNDCIFPSGWTVETLFERHRSVQLNPNIARCFFYAGFVETWGRGIQRICESCQENGNPMPEYKVLPSEITLKLSAAQANPEGKRPSAVYDLSGDPEEVICFLKENPGATYEDIAKELGVSRSTAYRQLDYLRNTGRLIRNPHSSKRKWTVVER